LSSHVSWLHAWLTFIAPYCFDMLCCVLEWLSFRVQTSTCVTLHALYLMDSFVMPGWVALFILPHTWLELLSCMVHYIECFAVLSFI
jgi:hypothetical protein